MNSSTSKTIDSTETIAARTAQLFQEQHQNIVKHTDWLFARLMVFQWLFGLALAVCISPKTWAGAGSSVHAHVWAAILLGGAVTAVPVLLAIFKPGETMTRHVVAVGQMLMSALLIHLTGGRIETHFHVFGSLAILAFYRDWRVLISASAVVLVDHLLRGFFWPQSVYGVLNAPIWRSFEHAGWVVFEVTFLILSIRKSLSEMHLVAERQAKMEALKDGIEQTVAERTAELAKANAALRAENAERDRAEQKLHIEYAVSRILAKSPSWEQAMREVLQTICGIMNWDAGTFWKADYGAGLLRCGEVWSGANLEAEEFRTLNRPMTFARNIALPGRVWAYGQSAWVRDIVQDPGFPRIISAKEGGLHGAFAFPILIGKNAAGVVELFCRELREPDEDFLLSLNNIGNQLGQFFERKRIEGHLFQSQKMETVGRLAGGVAHDFNNLLTVICGYCDLSLLELPDNNPMEGNIVEIQKAARRAGALTGQLLAFSRKQVLQPRVLNLNEVVQNMEKMLRRLIGEDIDLSTVFETSLGHVKADPGQVEQVIMNLAVNARDAMPRGGKLTISTSNVAIDQRSNLRNRTLEPGQYVMLAISDNGMGMSEDVQAHLFEPFFTTKGLGKGTGLGLATCHGIICQSGGDIRVYSEVNTGTTFKIYLPRTDAVLAAIGNNEPKLLPKGSESILVVEDEPAVRTLAVRILRQRGYQVQESGNAFEALEMIRKNAPFHLVLTDVIMPQMSGKSLHDEIMSQRPGSKVLLMSGYTDDALAHHGVLDEGLSFLEKPFSAAQLTRKVRDVLDAPNLHQPVHRNGGNARLAAN
jgi:two-component system, cell cycle sensor histidine kinase and response regulator CckA